MDLPADTVVSMNMWGFTPDFITEAKAGFVDFLRSSLPGNPLKCEYYLPTVVTEALETGKAEVKVLTTRTSGTALPTVRTNRSWLPPWPPCTPAVFTRKSGCFNYGGFFSFLERKVSA